MVSILKISHQFKSMVRAKSIKHLKNLAGKRVLLRSDFNVPIKNGKILDDFKIVAALPTIRFLIKNKSKVVIATHLGEPMISKNRSRADRSKNKRFSTKPIAIFLEKVLGIRIKYVDDCIGDNVHEEINKMKEGDVIVLENLRFYEGEEKNDKRYAKNLASLADLYINNAFAVSHRNHASLSAIKKYLPHYAGWLLEKEIESLEKVLCPKKPLVVIMGGVKISTKLPLLMKLEKVADHILLGGGLANSLLLALDYKIGKSVAENDKTLLKKLSLFYKKIGSKKIILPIDLVVSDKNNGKGKIEIRNAHNVKRSEYIYDIGPKTISFYSKFIKKANTIMWNGPMGMFENKHFKHGTVSIAYVVGSRSTGEAFGTVGGGETIEALKLSKMTDYIDWVSTGGGAMLTYLSGEKMPGLEGIIK